MFVYVLNCHGKPLMPCRPRKARMLLKAGKAKVVKMVPFTLQLRYGSSGYKQEVSLGIDAGTRHIGVSATTEKAVLFEAEGWLAPSVRHLVEAHLKTMRLVQRILPVRRTTIEVAQFDLQ